MAITNKVLEFTLELTPGGIPPIIHASQGDVGRTFKANVVWNGSAASAYISGTTVKLRGKKPDKTVFDYSATLSGSAVTFATTEQMTIIGGPVECELVFTSGDDVVASANFVLIVEESPWNPDALSESDVEGLSEMVSEQVSETIADDIADAVDPLETEVTDIRTGYDGAVYASAGDAVRGQIGDIHELFEPIVETSTVVVPLEINKGKGYYNKSGVFTSEASIRRNAIVEPVTTNETYYLTTHIGPTLIPAILYFNGDSFLSYELAGTGTQQDITDFEFTIPANCNKLIVQCTDTTSAYGLKKVVQELNVYTKAETDSKISEAGQEKYGVKWEISNADDLGQRCFSAEGLTATIGIGSTSGNSDFDNIYPWSEIKRCNIKANANGADIVTFEGETGFALDGTNGDVFVRIPKFCYSHYIENGMEYITISKDDGDIHPAFIENGAIIDEIFVGAFEGYLSDSKLTSIGGVIPSSNETLSTFLTSAQSKGDRYSLYDMRCMSAIWCLMAVEFGCRNTNQIVGYGYADFLQPVSGQYGLEAIVSATNTNTFTVSASLSARVSYMPLGSNITICKGSQTNILTQAKLTNVTSDSDYIYLTFDGSPVDIDTTCFIGSAGCTTNFCETAPSGALTYHTGRANWISGSTTKNPVRYRWIENIVGSLWHLFPDITFNNLQMYQCKNMKDYVAHSYTGGYAPVGGVLPENNDIGSKGDTTNVNYWINTLTNDYFSKEILFGKTYDKSLTSQKAFGGYYYLQTGTVAIANGGGFDHLWRCNMLTNRAWIEPTRRWYLYGARLMYKHIN